MTKKTAGKPYARAKLQDTDAMAERFRRFGLEGWPYWMIAQELSCHANTVGSFLRRAPKCDAAHKRGLEAAAKQGKMAGGHGWQAQRAWRAARRPAEPKPGEICPTCRQTVRENEQAITLTRADLAEARGRFDDLIARHSAARRADRDDGEAG
jgi:hypothetical protein